MAFLAVSVAHWRGDGPYTSRLLFELVKILAFLLPLLKFVPDSKSLMTRATSECDISQLESQLDNTPLESWILKHYLTLGLNKACTYIRSLRDILTSCSSGYLLATIS